MYALLHPRHECICLDGLRGEAVVVPPCGQRSTDGNPSRDHLLKLGIVDGQQRLTRCAEQLICKGETLLIVLVACQLDAVIGGSFVRDAAIIGFSANEAISIVENAGLMGLPIPAAITKAIDILKQRAETPEKGKD